MIGFARLFLANGYRVLLPDSRAQGASDGRFATYGVLERDDVHRWIDWVATTSHGAASMAWRIDGSGDTPAGNRR